MPVRLASPTRRVGIALPWLATFGACVVAIVGLHRLGRAASYAVPWSDLWGWLGEHSPEVVLMALARYAALLLVYWIAGSLVASTAARASRIPALIRSVEWATLPPVRRLAARTVALSLTVSTITAAGIGPAPASTLPAQDADRHAAAPVHEADAAAGTGYVPVPAGDVAPSEGEPVPAPGENAPDSSYVPVPAGQPAPPLAPGRTSPPTPPRRLDPAAADAVPGGATLGAADTVYDHDVVPGDNLWTISENHLGRVLDREPTEAETATYWSLVIEVNRGRLRSGNPDLIFPGEVIRCPPTRHAGIGR